MTTPIPRSAFPAGPDHPRYRGGAIHNEHGYRRVTVGRRNQMPYEHRWVIEQLMLEQAIIETTRRLRQDSIGPDPWDESPAAVESAIEFLIAREVMALVANPPRIAPGLQVHHVDFDRQHNCPANLMLLDGPLHRAITAAHRRFLRRHNEHQMMSRLRDAGATE